MSFVSTAAQGQGGTAGGDLSGTYPNPSVAAVSTAILGSGAASSSTLLLGNRSWGAVPTSSLSGFPNDKTKGLRGNGNFSANSGSLAMYGDGSDGDVTITAGTTTLARDMFYNSLTITSTGILVTNGFRVFVLTTLTVNASGVINFDGANGGNGSTVGGAGASNTGAVLGGGSAGANGQVAASGGTGTVANSPALGGAGGAGGNSTGAGGVGGGGTGGAATAPTALQGGYRNALTAQTGQVFGNTGPAQLHAGGGGGGGWGTASNGGGGGGAAGGVICICALAIVNGGTIRSNGGNGGNGGGTNAGGGGGGGGGVVILMYDSYTGAGTLTATGGNGGALLGTGNTGAAGSPGTVLQLPNSP